MNQNHLIQTCFTMQMFFYQMFQNMLMITCSTCFQGAVNTYQKRDQIFLKKSLYAHKLLLLCPYLLFSHNTPGTPSLVLSFPQRLHGGAGSPMVPSAGQGVSQAATLWAPPPVCTCSISLTWRSG